jgi:hypothetical protein
MVVATPSSSEQTMPRIPTVRYIYKCLHASSAVNAQDLAVNPLAVLRRKEADHTCNVDGQADAMEG